MHDLEVENLSQLKLMRQISISVAILMSLLTFVSLALYIRFAAKAALETQASTLDKALRADATGNMTAAGAVGKLVAERAKAAGVSTVAFDRSGFRYHGRVKALAEAAREGGLEF